MNFRIGWAFIVFIGSYLPLSIILIIQDIGAEYPGLQFWLPGRGLQFLIPKLEHPLFSWTFFIFCLFAFLRIYKNLINISGTIRIKIEKSKSIPNDIINYVFPYVVSFMGLDLNDPRKVAGFFLFIFWMFLITHKSGQILMNPLFLVFGWNLFEAEIETGGKARTCRILSNKKLVDGESYDCDKVQDFYVINR